ncbi:hypothetical protein BT67DRAFT_374818 [Trichocladium antarcticum]|uniref:Uncharacterized protein n=1 Tax=Trichocladium antarcticum TaxID=1450529 RepID=A0AAN6UNN3_9PEZI|nr:hypothetical protein BT67DRAFT_374818 [Trichocladium antarcticum]
MNPPASQCCRALQRPIIPRRDAVWVTDSLLANAFERYCVVSRAWNRKVSHVPGPLESQRRLGRRRMGDAGTFHSPPTPPGWAFSMPLDLSQWIWEPPSLGQPAEQNQLPRDDARASKLSLSTVLSQYMRMNEALAEASDDAGLPPAPATLDQSSFATDMDAFRWAATYATPAVLAAYAENICPKFQHTISLGEMAPENVLAISSEIWTALESRGLFVDAMLAMPAAGLHRVSEGILCVLDSFFAAWVRTPRGPNAAQITKLLDSNMSGEPDGQGKAMRSGLTGSLRHARAITQALQGVTPDEPKGLLDAANRLVLDHATASATGASGLRYTWLCVLAQLPRVNQDYMFDAAVALSDPALKMEPLPSLELSSLLLTHWKSRGYLSPRLYSSYQRYCQGRDDTALSSLLRAIVHRGRRFERRGLYMSSWRLLAKLGRMDDVFQSLRVAAETDTMRVRMLEELAATSDNHHVAIRLHDLWARRLKKAQGDELQFNPSVFLKYVDRIVLDPQIPPKAIWRILEIKQFENSQTALREKTDRHRGAYGELRASIVERASAAFATAPHLPNRVALRHVAQSFYFIRAVRGHVPSTVIRDLYHVVTKDLVERKPGRTRRLLWFLSIVQTHYGQQVAWNCRLVLRTWRSRLTRVWISMGFNRTE